MRIYPAALSKVSLPEVGDLEQLVAILVMLELWLVGCVGEPSLSDGVSPTIQLLLLVPLISTERISLLLYTAFLLLHLLRVR